MIIKICRLFNKPADWLLGLSDEPRGGVGTAPPAVAESPRGPGGGGAVTPPECEGCPFVQAARKKLGLGKG
jgi:hypothetical protein